jgi:hypothetical protein
MNQYVYDSQCDSEGNVANLLSHDSYFALVFSSDHVSYCPFQPVDTQGVIEMCDQILATSYWLDVELGKNI